MSQFAQGIDVKFLSETDDEGNHILQALCGIKYFHLAEALKINVQEMLSIAIKIIGAYALDLIGADNLATFFMIAVKKRNTNFFELMPQIIPKVQI